MAIETITITRQRVVAVLPKVHIPRALRRKLQAEMAKRIEEMAYRAMTGGYDPAREQTALRMDSSGRLIPDGNKRSRGRYGAIINMDGCVT